MTTDTTRFDIACILGIEDFDDVTLINKDGLVRARFSEITMNGLINSGEDISSNYAEQSRIKYKQYLENKTNPKICTCCGQELTNG